MHDIVGIHSDVEIVDNKPLNLVNYFSMNRQRKTERSQSCKEKLMKFHRVLNFHSTKDGLLNCITKVYDNSILMDFIKCLVTNMQYTVPVITFSCYKSRSLNHYILTVFHITLYSTKIFVRIYIGDFQQPLSCNIADELCNKVVAMSLLQIITMID